MRNAGFLPTNVTERGLVGLEEENGTVRFQVTRSPLVVLELEGAEVVDGTPWRRIGHLAGASPHAAGVSERERTVRFEVAKGSGEASVQVIVHGEEGRTVRTERVALP